MKTTSEYMALLHKYMVENAHKYGIMRMGIFGSVARGEQTEDSDVDVCVELQTPSMFCLVHIKDELQHLFGCTVDIVRLRDDMDKLLKQSVMEDGKEMLYPYYSRRMNAKLEELWDEGTLDQDKLDEIAQMDIHSCK